MLHSILRFRSSSIKSSKNLWDITYIINILMAQNRFISYCQAVRRCMYRASYCNVYINIRDAQIIVNNLYFSLNGSTCFGLSLVHHQEQHLMSCTVQFVHAGTSVCCMAIARTSYEC